MNVEGYWTEERVVVVMLLVIFFVILNLTYPTELGIHIVQGLVLVISMIFLILSWSILRVK